MTADWHDKSQDYLLKLARYSLAIGLMILLFLLSVIPMRLGDLGQVFPPLMLMAVSYWAIFRPSFFPPLAVFFTGIAQDLLSATPLGVNALLLLLTYRAVTNQRIFLAGQSFLLIWWGFLLIVFLTTALKWVMISVLEWTFYSMNEVFLSAALGLFLFPFIFILLHFTHKVMAEEDGVERSFGSF